MGDQKRKTRGDRKDAKRIRGLDPMHQFMPYLLPNRADNEAVMNETVDLTAINEYLAKKNADSPEYKYTFFHIICAAIGKTIVLRPKLNYFIAGHRFYERNEISFSFVVKKHFTDTGEEALAVVSIDREGVSPLQQFYEKTRDFVYKVRKENQTDGATDIMGVLTKLPRWLIRLFIKMLNSWEYHGTLPDSLQDEDPYHSTVFISNLGSIKMHADYHHLTNWGTNSIFAIVGEKRWEPSFRQDGSYTMREVLDLGLTIDERIADGVYFANSIRTIRKLLNNPELLELPVETPVEID